MFRVARPRPALVDVARPCSESHDLGPLRTTSVCLGRPRSTSGSSTSHDLLVGALRGSLTHGLVLSFGATTSSPDPGTGVTSPRPPEDQGPEAGATTPRSSHGTGPRGRAYVTPPPRRLSPRAKEIWPLPWDDITHLYEGVSTRKRRHVRPGESRSSSSRGLPPNRWKR